MLLCSGLLPHFTHFTHFTNFTNSTNFTRVTHFTNLLISLISLISSPEQASDAAHCWGEEAECPPRPWLPQIQVSFLCSSAVQCSAVQCSADQCSAVQFSAVQCSAVQCSAVQCSAVQTYVLNLFCLQISSFSLGKRRHSNCTVYSVQCTYSLDTLPPVNCSILTLLCSVGDWGQ